MASADNKLTVSEQRVHRTDLALVKKLIRSGRMGEIVTARYHDTIRPTPSFGSTWRNDPALAGGGVLFDLGYHTVNTLQWLFDLERTITQPQAAILRFGQLKVEDFAAVHLKYREINIFIQTALVKRHPKEFLEIVGSKATLTLQRSREHGVQSVIQITQNGKISQINCDLEGDYDSHALSMFLNFHASPDSLNRHVETVDIIEEIYGIARKDN
jgi:predicted dehydrogenase